MAETSIQWADYTFNPWIGCQRVSPGCENCYAETYDKRVGGVPKHQRDHVAALMSLGRALKPGEPLLRWGPKAPRVRTSRSNWREPLKWERAAAAEGVRKRVFCASLADVFEDRPEVREWREALFGLIASTPHLDWLLLTKRPENIRRLWPETIEEPDNGGGVLPCPPPGKSSWPNVWLGCTAEDQERFNLRVPHLLLVPAAVHFLSCEPLLERLNIWPLMGTHAPPHLRVDWVIIGGESGGNARRIEAEWVRDLVAKVRHAGAAPFVKQLGAFIVDRNDAGFEAENETWAEGPDAGQPTRPEAWPSPAGGVEDNINGYREEYQGADVRVHLRDRAGGDPAEWPLDLRVREFPEVARG